MAKKQEDPKKKNLFDELEEAKQKAQEEFEKLSPEEQKIYLEHRRHLQEKWDKTAYY